MNIKIISVGKAKEDFIISGIKEYCKRISKYATIEIVEISDESITKISHKEIDNIKKVEAGRIKKHIKQTDYIFTLDLSGKQFTSNELAKKFQEVALNGFSTLVFIIGGTVGLDEELLNTSDTIISFSKLTFPHQLIRLFLLEQIFRCFKINNNEKYHW